MKTIGLLGGMSWESTVTYYRIINEMVKEQLGGLHSAKILLYSVDFQEIETCQANGDWERSAEILGTAAVNLENAGADCILICTNTMHKVAPQIQTRISIPLIHIADAAAEALKARKITRTALLGTKYTMLEPFYKEKLIAAGIEVVIPEEEDISEVNRIIFEELCLGQILPQSKQKLLEIVELLKQKGAQAVVLGCTEIGMLIGQGDGPVPVFDTTNIHARKAADYALNGK